MAKHVPILATKQGAQQLQRILKESPTETLFEQGERPADESWQPVLAELATVPADGDDFDAVEINQVRRTDDTIAHLMTQNVRILGGRPVLLNTGGQLTPISGHLHLDVQLTEDLVAATNFATGAATATANVLTRNSSGDLEKLQYDGSDVQIEVVNRYEHWETVEANTFGGVVLKNDEWRPDDFDCEPAAGGLI